MVTLALALDQSNGLYHSLYRLCHRYPVFIVQHRNDCPADERSHLICDDLGHRHVQRLLSCIEQSVPDLSRVWHAISDRWEEKEMKVLQSLALLFFLMLDRGCSLYVSADPNSGQRHQHGPVAFVAAIGRIKAAAGTACGRLFAGKTWAFSFCPALSW